MVSPAPCVAASRPLAHRPPPRVHRPQRAALVGAPLTRTRSTPGCRGPGASGLPAIDPSRSIPRRIAGLNPTQSNPTSGGRRGRPSDSAETTTRARPASRGECGRRARGVVRPVPPVDRATAPRTGPRRSRAAGPQRPNPTRPPAPRLVVHKRRARAAQLCSSSSPVASRVNTHACLSHLAGGVGVELELVDVMDPYKYLKIRFNPDGSLNRYGEKPLLPAAPAGEPVEVAAEGEGEPARRIVVHSNDAPLNDATGTGLRLFVPSDAASAARGRGGRLPLIVYFHGGGYVLFRAASEPFHNTCAALAAAVPAAVASVDYRLAPEHRLPAAFEDAADAVRWARPHAAAGTPVFVMGSHNGASIAFRAALAATDEGVPLRGVILNQPHHSGVRRTAAEAASVDDRVLPLPANDLLWEIALPVGADRDHEFCNPEAMLAAIGAARLRKLPPCLVLGRRKDPPRDRTRTLVDALQSAGVAVEARLDGAGYHAMELFKPNCAAEFIAQVADFVRRHAAGDVAVTRSKL